MLGDSLAGVSWARLCQAHCPLRGHMLSRRLAPTSDCSCCTAKSAGTFGCKDASFVSGQQVGMGNKHCREALCRIDVNLCRHVCQGLYSAVLQTTNNESAIRGCSSSASTCREPAVAAVPACPLHRRDAW